MRYLTENSQVVQLLITEIESLQSGWRNTPDYDGGMAEDVRGMMNALDIITNEHWIMTDAKLYKL